MLGVYLCCRAVVPRMLERGRGRIVITGSGVRLSSRSTNSAYASSKAATAAAISTQSTIRPSSWKHEWTRSSNAT